MNRFQLMVKDICEENNIQMDVISRDWIIALEKNGIRRFIVGCRFDSNRHGLGQVLDDKFATYEALTLCNLPITFHQIQYSEKNHASHAIGYNKYEYVYEFFEKYNRNIVIKVNDGSQGNNCYHITNKNQIKRTLNKLFQRHYSLSLCPYYEIKNEYRVIMFDGNAEIVYQKVRPSVTGDGVHTIKELLTEFNPHYFKNKIRSKKYNKILKPGETFEYNWQFNLSKGAISKMEFDSKMKKSVINLAKKTVQTLGIEFASVDIVDTSEGLMILEINSGVATMHYREIVENGYEIAKKMYTKAILKMFE